MKHTKNMYVEHTEESRELYLYADNNVKVYPAIVAAVNVCAKHYKRGDFDSYKAIDAFYPAACLASKLYNADFGYSFTVTERFTAASILMANYIPEIRDGGI